MTLKKWREKGESLRVDPIGTGALKVAVYIEPCPRKNQGFENEDRGQAGNVQSK
jgi:hypothetical protein